MGNKFFKLMLITNRGNSSLEDYLKFIKNCADSGITSLQLREKNASFEDALDFGIRLKEILSPYNIPLIVNDNIDLALKLDAEGVHLGQSDMCVKDVRAMIGKDKIIGLSIESFDQLLKANNNPEINYVSASAIFPTDTKLDCKNYWGIEGLKKFTASTHYNVMAIGGITLNNVHDVIKAGAIGVAVIDAIHNHPDPCLAVAKFIKIINQEVKYARCDQR